MALEDMDEEQKRHENHTTDTPHREEYSETFLGALPRIEEGHQIVKINSLLAIGTGLIPIPVIGTLTITGIQVKMISELAQLYKIDFSDHAIKSILTSICAGLAAETLGQQLGGFLITSIPGLGPTFSFLGVSSLAAGSTYAVGQAFLKHFESGGTLLNISPKTFRQSVRQFEREKARTAA